MDSFPTQVDNADTCNVSMDMDIHDSRYILSNDGNDNGQSANVHDSNDNGQNSKQSNDNMQSSNLDPSSDTIHSTQS